jgi:hypothetical protein
MPARRTPTRPITLLALAIAALIAACTPPAPTVEITSHTDGQRIFGTRTITVAGTATNTPQVQVVRNGTIVATVAVTANTFTTDVTLDDNRNELRVQTPNALVGDDLDLVYPWVDATTFRPMDVAIGQPDKTSNTGGTSASQTLRTPTVRRRSSAASSTSRMPTTTASSGSSGFPPKTAPPPTSSSARPRSPPTRATTTTRTARPTRPRAPGR